MYVNIYMSNKTCNICYEEKHKNKFFNYKCCANASMCSSCMAKSIFVSIDSGVYYFNCPFCKQKVFFDYKEIEKFTKDELYILIHKYMESINKLNNILNSII